MPNEISTQQSNMAMTFNEGSIVNANLNQYGSLSYYKVPVYPIQVGGNNIYQSFPYNWHTVSILIFINFLMHTYILRCQILKMYNDVLISCVL
ncbi:hypothetical protein WN943_028863 [Citrus x changshan-huyou]